MVFDFKFNFPKHLYHVDSIASCEVWDKVYGKSTAILVQAALVQKATAMKEEHERRGVAWAVQHVPLPEKMVSIERIFLWGTTIVVCLKGPDSDYKKRKSSEAGDYW